MVNPTPSGHFLVVIMARFPQRAFRSAKIQHFYVICKFYPIICTTMRKLTLIRTKLCNPFSEFRLLLRFCGYTMKNLLHSDAANFL